MDGGKVEVGMSDGSPKSLKIDEGVRYTDNVVQHVRDVGACYFSLWNWHRIQADRVLNYYHQFPDAIDGVARQIGYRVRPSWVWTYEEGGYPGLIVGFVNDGIAGVPGVLRVSVVSSDGKELVAGGAGCGLSTAGKSSAGKVSVAEGNEVAGTAIEGGNRSEGTTISGAVGMPAKTE